MTNSLSKDSHITQAFWHSQKYYSGSGMNKSAGRFVSQSVRKESNSAPEINRTGISVRKPAEISFCGFSGAKLANSDTFAKLMNISKEFLPEKTKLKVVREFINNAVVAVKSKTNSTDTNIQNFLKKAKSEIQSVISEAERLVKDDNKGKNKSVEDLQKDFDETIAAAVDGFRGLEENAKNPKNFYNNQKVQWFLKLADDNQSLFNAIFALGLTCVLRPLTIMALPGEKKNNDDKKYAAAHSIASGIIALGISIAISNPIASAVKKITSNPKAFIKNPDSYLFKTKHLFTAATIVKMFSETLYSPPKAAITIALIPLILKNIFGITKSKKENKKDMVPITENYAALNKTKIDNAQKIEPTNNGGIK